MRIDSDQLFEDKFTCCNWLHCNGGGFSVLVVDPNRILPLTEHWCTHNEISTWYFQLFFSCSIFRHLFKKFFFIPPPKLLFISLFFLLFSFHLNFKSINWTWTRRGIGWQLNFYLLIYFKITTRTARGKNKQKPRRELGQLDKWLRELAWEGHHLWVTLDGGCAMAGPNGSID